jgi:hypothetical protein
MVKSHMLLAQPDSYDIGLLARPAHMVPASVTGISSKSVVGRWGLYLKELPCLHQLMRKWRVKRSWNGMERR